MSDDISQPEDPVPRALKTRRMKTTVRFDGVPGERRDSTGTIRMASSGSIGELEETFCSFLLDTHTFNASREYRIIRRIGSGTQGVVLEAEHPGYLNCSTRRALKVFEPSMFDSRSEYEDDLIRIAGQVGILSQIYHPNLVQCEGFYHHEGVGILEMELVDGITTRHMLNGDLHQRLQRQVERPTWERWNDIIFAHRPHRIQPGVAFYILRKVLRGLEVLHRAGYIHCDIKPSNIMIDRFGTVKLIDFGRAVPTDCDVDFFLGSPLYMAPEVHQRREMSPSSDLYSAGIVTLEMLAGRPLVDLEASEDEIHLAKLSLPDRIHEYLPDNVRQDTAVETILRRLLAVDAHDRFASALEADDGSTGALAVHRQLAKANLDADYGRELEHYLAHRLPPARTRRR